MSHLMISVVMPVYNAEKYVAEAIESILSQTYSDFEFIIIDDCSTDGSYKVLEHYAKQDKRIRLLRNDVNSKLPKTLNLGIAQAKGKYIARMDADDISLPERFAKQIEFMESNSHIGVCGSWYSEFKDNVNSINNKIICEPEFPDDISITLLFHRNCIAHPSVLMRKEVFNDFDLCYEDEDAEDYGLWVRLVNKQVKFYNVPQVLLYYRKSIIQSTVTNKCNLDRNHQNIISANYKLYFSDFISIAEINKFVKLKTMAKHKLNFTEILYYFKFVRNIKRINKREDVFNFVIFDRYMNHESFIGLIKRLKDKILKKYYL